MKLPSAFNTATAENPSILHRYDVAKGITTRSDFIAKAGYTSFGEFQKFVRFPELNFLFRESSQIRSIIISFSLLG